MTDVSVKLRQYQFEKIIRMLKSNVEKEANFHRHFYSEGETSPLSEPYRLGLGWGWGCFLVQTP